MKTVKTITSYAGTTINTRKVARDIVTTLKKAGQVAKVFDNKENSLKDVSQRWVVQIECNIVEARQTLRISRKPSLNTFSRFNAKTVSKRRTGANKSIDARFSMLDNIQRRKETTIYTAKR